MNTYARLPVAFNRGEGAWLHDEDGNRYLDAISGIAVCSLGHAHPAVAAAVCRQSETLLHTSNIYQISLQQQLGDKLTALSGMDRVFFANSGAEANEAAIKIARLYGHSKGIDKPEIIVTDNSFHGRTLATLSATGNRKIQAGFEPLVSGFVRVPYNDMEALRAVARNDNKVVAILVEPVQGEGGVNVPADDYLDNIRALCDEHGWLMMLDEIQTGMCRTGKWFGFQHSNSTPDVMTLAKALGNGVPIGACLAQGKAADVLGPGSHGSTFGGNLLACAAGNAVVDTMQANNMADQAAAMSQYLLTGFNKKLADNPHVSNIRGKGLLIGIELDRPCKELVQQALEQKLLINVTADRVIRLLPPLVIDQQQADIIIDTVSDLVVNFCRDAA
jgi:acetylornithine aminotransferase